VSLRGALLLLGLAAVSLVLATRREAPSPIPARASAATAARPQARLHEPAVDPSAIRDVFRFAERPAVAPPPPDRTPAPAETSALPTPDDPVRLVGLVRRNGRLLAAFAVDGDVVLAGPGEAAGEVTVLEVGEDAVRIRRRDGIEERLVLP
jgi:hypothetical protein